jgi:hypothetical protein
MSGVALVVGSALVAVGLFGLGWSLARLTPREPKPKHRQTWLG